MDQRGVIYLKCPGNECFNIKQLVEVELQLANPLHLTEITDQGQT